jgi:hypothetical protein
MDCGERDELTATGGKEHMKLGLMLGYSGATVDFSIDLVRRSAMVR